MSAIGAIVASPVVKGAASEIGRSILNSAVDKGVNHYFDKKKGSSEGGAGSSKSGGPITV